MKESGHRGVRREYRCSFCDKSQDRVKRLIAGPRGVFICNECIDLCQEIIHEEEKTVAQFQEGQEQAQGGPYSPEAP